LPNSDTTTSPVAVIATEKASSTETKAETETATAIAAASPANTDTDKSPSSIVNELKEMEFLTEKLNMLNNLLSIFNNPPIRKTVNITPEIFNNTYKNFEISLTSLDGDINEGEMIKGFGYNSSMGNIRDYNEDTITATKVKLNEDENNYFYFFGVYDGHGGKGCSFYLKDNLHKNINEFSSNGLKLGIEKTEEKFKKEEALNENGEIKDPSGSCGIVAMIKGKKLIIGNVGDSRLVIFKNGLVSFTTEDHKPGSDTEKKRIEAAGGKIYQTPSIYPLYQNGKEIETPWRVLPGRLSVSRTFGDIEAKDEKFGGMKGVVVALPDITEIELNDEYNLIVIGCDGIFDVISNEELLECIKIVLKEKKINEVIKDEDIHELCGDFAAMIIKSALAKDSFDNVSCIVIALNLNGLLEKLK
jgi:protein phosphatase 2C family protein 2/3